MKNKNLIKIADTSFKLNEKNVISFENQLFFAGIIGVMNYQ